MSRDARWPGVIGGLYGACGVGLSAYAAHAATGDAQHALYTAAAMALVHAVALVSYAPGRSRAGSLAQFAFALGVLLFSGSLVGAHVLGWPTRLAPAGGMILIAGWLFAAVERSSRR
ncbi:DUF423 domain-containing protein [Lysobacter sp. TY2-98]|uniref:DUF423 domain-containing protein n=1 Tax=Lysobacter sp. TY2-98 TaxID=2290922 RepID=UPI0013B41A43|nr:DUF423 domain-containing protein [Lysobacter sp. TY2-98]